MDRKEYIKSISDISINDIETCDCCSYPAELQEYPAQPFSSGVRSAPRHYCKICTTTLISNLYEYPDQFPNGTPYLGAAIAYIGNAILDELKSIKNKQ